jgi:hypothetical protein
MNVFQIKKTFFPFDVTKYDDLKLFS